MELAVLKAQLNPHFLFNTLNSINALVGSDPEAARRVLAQLAEVLRYSLESDRQPLVPLSEELRFVETYLAIEKARFGKRLQVKMEIDESARPLLVPPMILQPLAENAVKHGIAPKAEGGELLLRVQQRSDHLEIEVADNGAGSNGIHSGNLLNNGRRAVAAINHHKPDLIFLDVQMPGLNGFQVIEQLEHVPAIIFSTAYDEYAIRAFEVNAVDYLLKPFDRQRFAMAVQRAIDRRTDIGAEMERLLRLLQQAQPAGTFPDRLLVRSSDRIIPVRVADLEWIEAADDYAMLHAGSSKHLCNLGLGELEKKLNPQQFMRVHRSAIINLSRIRHLEKDGEGGMVATMASGEEVKVSRRYAATLRELVV